MQTQYKITNEIGLTGPAWDASYPNLRTAGEALREAMGWPDIVFSTATDGSFFYAYPTDGELQADIIRLGAPRVLRVASAFGAACVAL